MATNSSNSTSRRKSKAFCPKKPFKTFPLTLHPSGRWVKRFNGRAYYFGYWNKSADGDWEAAQAKYEREWPYIVAGKPIPDSGVSLTPADDGRATVNELFAAFLNNKFAAVENGDLSLRSFHNYKAACKKIEAVFGGARIVETLTPTDFAKLRQSFASGEKKSGKSKVSIRNDVRHAKIVFKWGAESGMFPPVLMGPEFKIPKASDLRKERNEKRLAHGRRMFERDELMTILAKARQPLRAMVLLAANCGFGQTDVANLPLSALDLDAGWCEYGRNKTGIHRRIPLWPETVQLLREVLAKRPNAEGADLVFLTARGNKWVRVNPDNGNIDDQIACEFSKLLKTLGIKRPGVNFYALRHGFETIGGEAKDPIATSAIMGHADHSMSGAYREGVSDERLRAVVDHVRAWLFEGGAK